MIALVRTAVLAGLVCFSSAVCAMRGNYSEREAWADASVVIVRGSVSSVSRSGGIAQYQFRVLETLKPRGAGLAPRISITDPAWGSTEAIALRSGGEFLAFLQQRGDHFESRAEFELESPAGREMLRGVRLFLKIMYTSKAAEQRRLCVNAWNAVLSEPEKQGVLDAMWETRTPLYSEPLLRIASGKDSPRVREWAITILAYIGDGRRTEELVPLLLDDPDFDVKRQLLLLFGDYRVQDAVPAIDRLLNGDAPATLSPWQTTSLRAIAQEARDKITGKNTSPYWKN
jgi:hypothetical protein